MTTIAYRDGVIAGDSLICENDRRVGSAVKVGCVRGILFGAAGTLGRMQAFREWITRGALGDPPKMDAPECNGAQAIMVIGDEILTYDLRGWDRMRADFCAIGSGAALALGAMACGASAAEAVSAAAKIDVYTGGEITVLAR